MLKIPTFVLGGLLILTGLVGYLFQDPGLSLKITGTLADDAVFTLSDGNQTHELDPGSSGTTAGEQAYWLVYLLNLNHAKDRAQETHGAEKRPDYEKRSYWYASSKGDTLTALMDDADNYKHANDKKYVAKDIKWGKFDTNESTVRLVFKNEAGSPGPVTLSSTNWQNVKNAPPKGKALTFSKSWTALIPAIIGLLLIGLAAGSEAKPDLRKHLMHAAALIGLLGFGMVVKKIPGAVSEMNWLKGEPYGIIQVSLLKPAAFVFTAGLLLIFVVLCIVSFIQARKEMASRPKPVKKREDKKEKDDESDDFEDEGKKDDSEKDRKKDDSKAAEKKTDKKEDASKAAEKKAIDSRLAKILSKEDASKSKTPEKKAEAPRTIYKPKPSSKPDSDDKTKPDSEDKTTPKPSPDDQKGGKIDPVSKSEPDKKESAPSGETKDKDSSPASERKEGDASPKSDAGDSKSDA